jgi:hypothetical protein
MRKKNLYLYLVLLSLLLVACKPSESFIEARKTVLMQASIAILPPVVEFESYKILSPSKLQASEEKYSFSLQQKVAKRIQKKAKRQKSPFQIQPIQKTNQLLSKAGYFDDEAFTASELCDVLQVDGILFSEFLLYNLDEGIGCCLLPVFRHGKEISMYIEILDSQSDVPIFTWDYTINESADERYFTSWMMRDISRIAVNSLPYFEHQLIR